MAGSSDQTPVWPASKKPGPALVAVSSQAPPSRTGSPSAVVTNAQVAQPELAEAAALGARRTVRHGAQARDEVVGARVEPVAQVDAAARRPALAVVGERREVQPGQRQREPPRRGRGSGRSGGCGASWSAWRRRPRARRVPDGGVVRRREPGGAGREGQAGRRGRVGEVAGEGDVRRRLRHRRLGCVDGRRSARSARRGRTVAAGRPPRTAPRARARAQSDRARRRGQRRRAR